MGLPGNTRRTSTWKQSDPSAGSAPLAAQHAPVGLACLLDGMLSGLGDELEDISIILPTRWLNTNYIRHVATTKAAHDLGNQPGTLT